MSKTQVKIYDYRDMGGETMMCAEEAMLETSKNISDRDKNIDERQLEEIAKKIDAAVFNCKYSITYYCMTDSVREHLRNKGYIINEDTISWNLEK